MRSSDQEKLLDDLLRDPNYEAFRAEVYDLSLTEFRAGRRRHSAALYLAVAASIVLAGLLAMTARNQKQPALTTHVPAVVIQNDQVPIISFVETVPLGTWDVVRSVPDRTVMVEIQERAPGTVEFFQSNPATVSEVNDAQLLALFPNDGVGFIHTASGKRLVLFADMKRL